jgi:hypothetical protein
MTTAELEHMSSEKLTDAEILFANKRWEGSHYLCGYSIEFKLKARICKTLQWTDYLTGDGYISFKTHKLPILLSLSGVENLIKTGYRPQWDTVSQWNPEMRYNSTNLYTQASATAIINDTKILLTQL